MSTNDEQGKLPHDPDPECDCHDCQKWLEDERIHYRSRIPGGPR